MLDAGAMPRLPSLELGCMTFTRNSSRHSRSKGTLSSFNTNSQCSQLHTPTSGLGGNIGLQLGHVSAQCSSSLLSGIPCHSFGRGPEICTNPRHTFGDDTFLVSSRGFPAPTNPSTCTILHAHYHFAHGAASLLGYFEPHLSESLGLRFQALLQRFETPGALRPLALESPLHGLMKAAEETLQRCTFVRLAPQDAALELLGPAPQRGGLL
mmetsp:Transcript_48681/g.139162  ORF Transcript_48681/g.139162 Transcript_48681/m.139162 type:complete len:210 (+) Transcript_48681:1659-2288(+)